MCDTFHPLTLTKFAKDLGDRNYAYSWYENAQEPRDEATVAASGTRAAPGSPHTFSQTAEVRRLG
jgi:hypothetical protein